MTAARRRSVVDCELGRHSAWFSPAPVVFKVLSESGVTWMRDPFRKRPTVPIRAADDVLARLEMAGVMVTMVTTS